MGFSPRRNSGKFTKWLLKARTLINFSMRLTMIRIKIRMIKRSRIKRSRIKRSRVKIRPQRIVMIL